MTVDSENRMPLAPVREKQDRFVIPYDVSEWINKDLLRQWTIAEIGTLDWQHPGLVTHLQKHPGYHPRELLHLLTYAYATSLFESEGIVMQSVSDPALRLMLQDYSPTVKEVSRFRKENRGLLRWSLMQLVKRAVRERYGLGDLIPAGIRRCIEDDATQRLELARHMDHAAHGG